MGRVLAAFCYPLNTNILTRARFSHESNFTDGYDPRWKNCQERSSFPGAPLPERKNIILTRDRSRRSVGTELIFTDQSPESIIANLAKMGYEEVILAGGSIVNTLFARANLIDEIIITIVAHGFENLGK